MNVTFACSKCDATTRSEIDASSSVLRCDHCGHETAIPAEAVIEDRVDRCLVCPSQELYVRKDFPQRLGVTIVIIGVVLSSITWFYHSWLGTFAVLFAMAAIDVFLYWVTGNLLQCYRCQAQYRAVPGVDSYGAFDLEVHERYRQELIRLEEADRARSRATGEQPAVTVNSSPTAVVGRSVSGK